MSVNFVIIRQAGDWARIERAEEGGLAAVVERALTAAAEVAIDDDATASDEVAIVLSDNAHVQNLNATYRDKNAPTNVLAFPTGDPRSETIGDVVIALETVEAESTMLGLPFEHRFAHLVVHGYLHLRGYDHIDEAQAEQMESLEREALRRINIPDPYAVMS